MASAKAQDQARRASEGRLQAQIEALESASQSAMEEKQSLEVQALDLQFNPSPTGSLWMVMKISSEKSRAIGNAISTIACTVTHHAKQQPANNDVFVILLLAAMPTIPV